MTDELQRPAEGHTPPAFTGSLESLGFTAPANSPASAIEIPAAQIAATSRRALREAERANARAVVRPAPRPAADRPVVAAPSTVVPTMAMPTAAAVPVTEPAAFASSRRAQRDVEHAAPAERAAAVRPARRLMVERPALRPEMRHGVQPSRVPVLRRIARRALPPTVMLAVAGLLIGTTVPANALFRPSEVAASSGVATMSSPDETTESAQVLELDAAATVAPVASRDEWTVTSYVEILRAKYGNRDFSYTTTGTGAVRWPFPFASSVSSGFGQRVSPCRGCSSDHRGTDFTPGYGTPIQAVADGVVSDLNEGWSYGEHVFIDHVVNGQQVTTLYAHMEEGSSPLVPGQVVNAGDFVGRVGNSGASTGPHLHLEVRLDGIPVDSFAWLTTNAS